MLRPRSDDPVDPAVIITGVREFALQFGHARTVAVTVVVTVVVTVTGVAVVTVTVVTAPVIAAAVSVRVAVGIIAVGPRPAPPTPEREAEAADEKDIVIVVMMMPVPVVPMRAIPMLAVPIVPMRTVPMLSIPMPAVPRHHSVAADERPRHAATARCHSGEMITVTAIKQLRRSRGLIFIVSRGSKGYTPQTCLGCGR